MFRAFLRFNDAVIRHTEDEFLCDGKVQEARKRFHAGPCADNPRRRYQSLAYLLRVALDEQQLAKLGRFPLLPPRHESLASSWLNGKMDSFRLGVQDDYGDLSLHQQSHVESFLALLENRFGRKGFYVLDEPEAASEVTRELTMLYGPAKVTERQR